MRVLKVIDTGGTGGAETVFLNLVRGLAARQFEVTALLPYDGWLSGQLLTNDIVPRVLDSKGSFRFDYVVRLARLARQLRIDVIHAHLIGSATYGALAGRLAGIPAVATFHGPTDLASATRMRGARAWLLRHLPARTTAVSNSTVEALQDFGVPARQIQFIPNGIDTDRFTPAAPSTLRAELGFAPDAPVIGAVGNVRPGKGYDVLLRAAAIVLKVIPTARFVVAGEGNEQQMAPMLELRRDLGIEQSFLFLGYRQADAALYCGMDVFVSSSHSEGLPLSFLEAMACGCRIVATASGGAEEVLDGGRYGVIVPPASPEQLASALLAAIDPAQQIPAGRTVRERVVSTYSLKGMLDQYEGTYRTLVGAPRAGLGSGIRG